MVKILRDYQREAVASLFSALRKNPDVTPLCVMPTGSGKSLVIADFVAQALLLDPNVKILILSHVKELIYQNFQEFLEYSKENILKTGIVCAGLKRKDTQQQIIFGTIQSAITQRKKIGKINIIIIDEAHRLPTKSHTQYQQFIKKSKKDNPQLRIIGLTATPYRQDSGSLIGNGQIFSEICHETEFLRLVNNGFLAPLTTKKPRMDIDLSKVHTHLGDYKKDELDKTVNTAGNNKKACEEIIRLGKNKKSWLVFCCSIDHTEKILDILRKNNVSCQCIHSKMSDIERDQRIQDFKNQKIKAIINCNILTTGFNHPDIDMLVILRPTQSTSLYVQMIGRGTRIANGKSDCLVLDFGENIQRHGPISNITEPKNRKNSEKKDYKVCPECDSYCKINAVFCDVCGAEFPKREMPDDEEKIQQESSNENIMRSEEMWKHVTTMTHQRWEKKGKPDSIRIIYFLDEYPDEISEWICPEHGGYASRRAFAWLALFGIGGKTIDEILQSMDEFPCDIPARIKIKKDGKWWRILEYDFSEPQQNPKNLIEDDDIPF